MDPQNRQRIERRARFLRNLPWITWLAPLAWLAICAYTFTTYPLTSNPWHVKDAIERQALSQATLETQALLCPIVVVLLQLVILVFIVFTLIGLWRERRLVSSLTEGEQAQ